MDEFEPLELSPKAERNWKKIQPLIVGCVDCQSYDGGEITWRNGEETELIDLFHKFNVPEEQWESIADNLSCRNCGSSFFNVWSDVGVKSKFDIALDKYIDQTLKKYGPAIKEFDRLLENVPLLAYSNTFGRKIYKDIKELNFPVSSVSGTFFRAREAKSSEVLTMEKMMSPPTGKSKEGRYNHSGQSHLYLSKDLETAIEEVIGIEDDKIVWVLDLELKAVNNILDLSFDWTMTTPETSPIYFTLCGQNFISRSERNNELWRPDYFITRYLADCAKHLGYNGIKYNSALTSYIENIVLFYPENCVIEAKGEPQLRLYKKKKDDYRRGSIDI